ncbi:MAG: hypothetical protein H8E86_01920 [Planctomycetes bacterium]|nr:hypothetical protein [Planctomycetota bacterium]
MSKKKGLDLDTQKIIAWCKGNIVLVILIIVSIASIVGFPKMAATMEDDLRGKLKDRANKFSELDKFAQTKISLPASDESSREVVNQALIDEYVVVTGEIIEEAQKVIQTAIELNSKEYQVLFAGELFPSPTQAQMETLPQLFYRQLEKKYKDLLTMVRAGSPTSREELVASLEDERIRFMDSHLSTKQDADLTQEQRSSLEKHLSKIRMTTLRTHAQDIGLYLEESTLDIPTFSLTVIPSVGKLFVWQWRYWAVADVLGSIASITDRQSEPPSPVTQVISLEVLALPAITGEAPKGGAGNSGSGGSGGGFGGNSGGGNNNGGPLGAPLGGPLTSGGDGGPTFFGGPGGPGKPTGPKPPTPPPPRGGNDRGNDGEGSLADSFTGRTSGELFDVLQVRVSMIVDTQRIPTILDGFARYNFFTVIDLELQPADKFLALDDGYDYGYASVSQMTVVFEAAWLRSWTTEYMPDEVKTMLGMQIETE